MEPLLYTLNEFDFTEEEKSEALNCNVITNKDSAPHKFFMNVLGIAKKKLKNLDYTSPLSKSSLPNPDFSRLQTRFQKTNTQIQMVQKNYKNIFNTVWRKILKEQNILNHGVYPKMRLIAVLWRFPITQEVKEPQPATTLTEEQAQFCVLG